jgi:hypothetical protein
LRLPRGWGGVFRVPVLFTVPCRGSVNAQILLQFLIARESLFDEEGPFVQGVLQLAQSALLQPRPLVACSLDGLDPPLHFP